MYGGGNTSQGVRRSGFLGLARILYLLEQLRNIIPAISSVTD